MTTATLPTRTKTWTVQEFHDANERREFGEGRRPILIRGQIVELGPMNPPHAQSVRRTYKLLDRLFDAGHFVQSQLPLVLNLDTDPEPDVAVIADNMDHYSNTHPTFAVLVVEVADTSLDLDMTTKAELYATAKIPEYWIVDLENRRLLVHRDPVPVPEGFAYRTRATFTASDSVTPLTISTAVRVADLLP